MKIFSRKAKIKADQLSKAVKVIEQTSQYREAWLQDEAENATRSAMFHSTTVYQLQMLVDQLRSENIQLKHEVERPSDGVLILNSDEASLAHTILDWYVAGIEEDEPLYDQRGRINFLIDRLQSALS